jgi:hypothetical protein
MIPYDVVLIRDEKSIPATMISERLSCLSFSTVRRTIRHEREHGRGRVEMARFACAT